MTDRKRMKVDGVVAVHELHIWRLNQEKSVASAHVVTSKTSMSSFMKIANTINECLHTYGIHSATLQPELALSSSVSSVDLDEDTQSGHHPGVSASSDGCMVGCQTSQCEQPRCCD